VHTGTSAICEAGRVDTVDQILKRTGKEVFFVPREHDVLNDDGAQFRGAMKGGRGGLVQLREKVVHFIGLVNVMNLKAGGWEAGTPSSLSAGRRRESTLKSSTPIVVFAHHSAVTVYPEWGWGTDDSAAGVGVSEKFGSVTV